MRRDIDELLTTHLCCTGRHTYFNKVKAGKCCNGWVSVKVNPTHYSDGGASYSIELMRAEELVKMESQATVPAIHHAKPH